VQRITRTRVRCLSVEIRVDCRVIDGRVSADEFVEWLGEAVKEYHRFRAGHVGVGARAGITAPEVGYVGDQT